MTADTGTHERKRALKAMPSPVDASSPGCVRVVLGYAALCLLLFWATRSAWWFLLAAPALLVLVLAVTERVYSLILLVASRRRLESRGVRCVVIYSDSPTWEEYIRSQWLPRMGRHAVVLNWSRRSTWPSSLEVRLFKHFVESQRENFNPAVLVLRGLRRPQVFRFYYAFQQARHGRRQYLDTLEATVFSELGV